MCTQITHLPQAHSTTTLSIAQLTDRIDLKEKWHYAPIQTSLQQVTDHLRCNTNSNSWIAAYPTCWSYTVGRTMHQLLQWNHRLTPSALREFLSITEENTEATQTTSH